RFMVASEIINMVGHYRHFFYSRLNMYTNVIFHYSDQHDSFRESLLDNYREDFYSKRLDQNHPTFNIMNGIIQRNVRLIKLFCEYVPHAYFINSGPIDSSLVPHLFLSE